MNKANGYTAVEETLDDLNKGFTLVCKADIRLPEWVEGTAKGTIKSSPYNPIWCLVNDKALLKKANSRALKRVFSKGRNIR